MKVKNIEFELTKEDIVLLLSDGTYDSPLYVGYVGSNEEILKFKAKEHTENPNVCIEDMWADWLLQGRSLYLDANDCDEEDEDYDKDLRGEFDLKRFNEMINKAYLDDGIRWNVENLLKRNDDFWTGYNLLQYIAFGEVILG